ncbi:MAG: hypothetical protein ACREJ3_08965, partial [Polyangiaceae bacterium]
RRIGLSARGVLVLAIASLWIAVPAVFQAFQRGAASGWYNFRDQLCEPTQPPAQPPVVVSLCADTGGLGCFSACLPCTFSADCTGSTCIGGCCVGGPQ